MSSYRNETDHEYGIFQQIVLVFKVPTYVHQIKLHFESNLCTVDFNAMENIVKLI